MIFFGYFYRIFPRFDINWLKVVAIVQAAFRDGTLAEESTWNTVFLIIKGAIGDFRGIGLLEVLWKTVTSLLNRRLTIDIKLHGVLHGFQVGRGWGPLPSRPS